MGSSAAPPSEVSRRGFLRTAGTGVAALAAAGAGAGLLRTPRAEAAAGRAVADPALHLLRRATYGPTPASIAEIRSMGTTAWLNRQLRPATIDDSACAALVAGRFPRLSWSMRDAQRRLDGGAWDVMFDLGVAALARAAWSQRQLFEVMVDFWSNHLNVTNPSSEVWYSRHDWDRTVIRAHALGRFEDMLVASAQHPAMLLYLNNAESNKDLPNENYGRELLELHTVSVDAGYSEDEMRNSVLVLTGFGLDWGTGEFHYNKDDHYVGPVQILGFSAKNGSAANGYTVVLDYLRYLANHPMTATHIARKLCLRFVSDTPPDSLVSGLAQTYLAKGTAIVPVLKQLFHSAEFAASVGQKVRRPMEDVVASVRTLGIQPDASGRDGLEGLYWMVDDLGNSPMAWSPPDGYPDYAVAWASAGGSLGRWNAHMALAAHWWPDQLVVPPLSSFVPSPLPNTHGALVQALAKRLIHRTLPAVQRDAVLSLIGKTADDPLHNKDDAVRWRLPYLMSLILDSPFHAIR